jgi:hypothetical protein
MPNGITTKQSGSLPSITGLAYAATAPIDTTHVLLEACVR